LGSNSVGRAKFDRHAPHLVVRQPLGGPTATRGNMSHIATLLGFSEAKLVPAFGRRAPNFSAAETFAAEFLGVTGRSVVILSEGESPDRVMLIDGIETGVELTAIHAGGAGDIIDELSFPEIISARSDDAAPTERA
jgi:hypothetical protein